ncbi:MAG: selenocysteine-specific translation elongation factor [Acidimicrobiia bacterium]|nr:MAG: selenocysteine-specific translation elongation factor [Acidimicrobiia bacterium]
MPVVGTAGHVDHGKSTLVEALTGRDPDRWAVEKERGLTIDLGFAWADLGNGTIVGFVDVPGHERFVRNMLAGVGGFNIALFVVAADEGWMPQSEEHLAVLDLLDVRHGVVALTRVDLAEADFIDLARADVESHVAGTVAESWPIVEVSGVTGDGLEDLRSKLIAALAAAGPTPDVGRPKLWIDRSFVVAGTGVVVTGTLVGGSIAAEDRLTAYPGGQVRIRSLQSHEEKRTEVGPGMRVAANLAGIERGDVSRGAVLARPNDAVLTDRVLIRVLRPPRPSAEVSDRSSYHVHLGTASVPAGLRFVETEDYAIVTLARPLPMTMGDRFILRDTGRRSVVAGGVVLDPTPTTQPTFADAEALDRVVEGGADERATALVTMHGSMDAAVVSASTGGGKPRNTITTADRFISTEAAAGKVDRAIELVDEFHAAHSLRPGMPRSSLASQLGVDRAELSALVAEAGGELTDDGVSVRRTGFVQRLTSEDQEAWAVARGTMADSLAVPRAGQLGLSDELLHAIVRRGDLIQVDTDLVFLPEQVNEIVAALEDIEEPFTVSAFRDALGLSRRHAVPLLEWLDRSGRTTRDGDLRTVRRR